MFSTILRVIVSTAAFGLLHSLLASLAAKQTAERRLGLRARNGLYRPFFILQSLASFGLLWAYLRRLPDRLLYQVRGPLALVLRLGQFAAFLYATWAAVTVGLRRITGWDGLSAFLRGKYVVPATPEAQGPAPGPDGRLQTGGPFAYSRHPLNFAPLPIFWLNPRMTVRLFSFNLAATLYLVLGSLHEEKRLLHDYGPDYSSYQSSGIPFYLPQPQAEPTAHSGSLPPWG